MRRDRRHPPRALRGRVAGGRRPPRQPPLPDEDRRLESMGSELYAYFDVEGRPRVRRAGRARPGRRTRGRTRGGGGEVARRSRASTRRAGRRPARRPSWSSTPPSSSSSTSRAARTWRTAAEAVGGRPRGAVGPPGAASAAAPVVAIRCRSARRLARSRPAGAAGSPRGGRLDLRRVRDQAVDPPLVGDLAAQVDDAVLGVDVDAALRRVGGAEVSVSTLWASAASSRSESLPSPGGVGVTVATAPCALPAA